MHRSTEWARRNPEKAAATRKRWKDKNKDHLAEYGRKYRTQKNPNWIIYHLSYGDEVYVGCTGQRLCKRIGQHFEHRKNPRMKELMEQSNGRDGWTWDVLHLLAKEDYDKQDALNMEATYIQLQGTMNRDAT